MYQRNESVAVVSYIWASGDVGVCQLHVTRFIIYIGPIEDKNCFFVLCIKWTFIGILFMGEGGCIDWCNWGIFRVIRFNCLGGAFFYL